MKKLVGYCKGETKTFFGSPCSKLAMEHHHFWLGDTSSISCFFQPVMLVFSGSFFWHQNFPPTKSEKKGFSDIDSPRCGVIPQIAIAIGVLTSNRGEGRRTTLADWTWHQGAIAGCSGRGAIAGCHCRVPLQCAMVGGGGWRPTLGEWTWCHCRVPL